MANWTGTYSITSGATGTLTSGATTTATNTGASWPTGAQSLANFQIRLLTGTGSPATVPIVSNTATVITVASWPSGTPNNTTTYEIVLLFKNNDHITAATTLSTNIITEIDDSATVLVDGSYIITLTTSSTVRWNKSESTIAGFDANNRIVQGQAAFWQNITISSGKTSPAPNLSYLKIRDCNYPILCVPSSALGDSTTVHHIWSEDTNTGMAYAQGASPTSSMTLSNFFNRWSTNASIVPSNSATTTTQIFENFWSENSTSGGVTWQNTNNPTLTWLRGSVMKFAMANHTAASGAGKEFRVSNNYVIDGANSGVMTGTGSSAAAGSYSAFHVIHESGRCLSGAGGVSTSSLKSESNDFNTYQASSFHSIDISAGTTYVSATSNFDYMAGGNAAALQNIDTTNATTSTASPQQYRNLTAARTNARSTLNFPLTIDNVVVGTPTPNSVTITCDSANGASAGQKTTVNADSASGQPVLNVASSTPFLAGMNIEIGYGTARSENGRIASVGAGTITLETNLAFTHTAAQGDTVSPILRQSALPFVRYGTASGVYTQQTTLPNTEDWGLFWTGLKTTSQGAAYTWKKTGHSVTLAGLSPITTYYATVYAYNPLENIMSAAAEVSFTTGQGITYSSTFS